MLNFMNTQAYKDYTTAYDKFIKKNPGYEEKIAAKLKIAKRTAI